MISEESKTLICLGLDETIWHTIRFPPTEMPEELEAYIERLNKGMGRRYDYRFGNESCTYLRKGAKQLIELCLSEADLCIFTAAKEKYAKNTFLNIFGWGIVNQLQGFYDGQYVAHDTTKFPNQSYKYTKLISDITTYQRVILIDDFAFTEPSVQLIKVTPYLGEYDDNELYKLLNTLKQNL